MTYIGDGTYVYRGNFNASSYFSFTTALAETSSGWDDIAASRFGASSNNYVVSVEDEPIQCGEYGESKDNAFLFTAGGDWEITLLLSDRLVMFHCYGEAELPDLVGPGMYILGNVNGKAWETNQYTQMTEEAAGIYTATISVADSAATFDFTTYVSPIPSDWARVAEYRFGSVEDGQSLTELLGQEVELGEVGVDNAFALAQGFYKITLNMNKKVVIVEETEPVEGIFIVGNDPFGNWDPAAGVAMATEDGKIFTYEATLSGDTWFIFAGAIGSWDIVNANRYGPESETEDQEVFADEDVQTQLTSGGKSYKIGAGEYVITFNKETLVFKFATKSGNPADVSGDGNVDVTDLNIVINVALDKDTNPKADVSGDGVVDVTDINLVLNAMLQQ